MANLQELIKKYRSDKNASNYTTTYEKEFEPIKDSIQSILEIGLGTIIEGAHSSMYDWKTSRFIDGETFNDYMPGASLRAWKEYFTNAQIYGGDIQQDTQFEEERIKTFLFNSTNLEECNKYLEDLQFDIIIDDGSHNPQDQINTMKSLYNRAKLFYIIEDIHSGNYSAIESELKNTFTDYKEFYYLEPHKNLLIIKK
tara:strand:- start:9304 stop:9897 length:594 start_codon:yes stop_codon:yes gene_type:complete